jgi:hypothetical protein
MPTSRESTRGNEDVLYTAEVNQPHERLFVMSMVMSAQVIGEETFPLPRLDGTSPPAATSPHCRGTNS